MKKKSFKGSIFLFIMAGIFLLLSTLVYGFNHLVTSKDYYLKNDRIYKKGTQSGLVVANIYSIEGPVEKNEAKSTEIYVVKTDKGIGFLELAVNDKELESIKSNSPYQMLVNIVPDRSSLVPKYMASLKLKPEEIRDYVRGEFLRSTSIKSSEDSSFIYAIMGMISFVALFAALGASRVIKNNRAYNVLFDKYEELEKDENSLAKNADFYDEKMGIALYKDHLIFFKFGMDFVDLNNVVRIVYILETIYLFGKRYCFNVVSNNGRAKKYYFSKHNKFGHETDAKVGELKFKIHQKFPNIDL